jgi:CheY-like chemotaxis protein
MAEKILRVLVADDIASNRTIVGAFLAHLDCVPLFAGDGVEAVDIFRRESPDVVLMDLMMPRMDGFRGHPADPGHRRRPLGAHHHPVGPQR